MQLQLRTLQLTPCCSKVHSDAVGTPVDSLSSFKGIVYHGNTHATTI